MALLLRSVNVAEDAIGYGALQAEMLSNDRSCQVYKGSKTLSSCRDRLDAIGLITGMVATEVRVVPGWC